MHITIINGPNLNLLGKRQPEIYGSIAFEDYLETLRARYPEHVFEYFQSNHEGAIIDKLQHLRTDGLVLNAAAYSHTSIAIADALACLDFPYVEVHISNIFEREDFRRRSYTAARAAKTIVGKGLEGYAEAVDFLIG